MTKSKTCCVPQRSAIHWSRTSTSNLTPTDVAFAKDDALVFVRGASFLMGSDSPDSRPEDFEGPVRRITVESFFLSKAAVTNREFAEFVAATDYRTDAERFGWSYVFEGLLPKSYRNESIPFQQVSAVPWWIAIPNACWSRPEGPLSSIDDREEHPVVHVSWHDAQVFCQWKGLRLPTEIEWEYAARGGLEGQTYPWGEELTPNGRHMCNIWQGTFPSYNSCDDGFMGTSPVLSYEPNGYGFFNMAGNVWEWCSNLFAPNSQRSRRDNAPRTLKGGSYLCHESYCNRYRVAARYPSSPDTSTGNCGFRVAKSANPTTSY